MSKTELEKEIVNILHTIDYHKGNKKEVDFWNRILKETTEEWIRVSLVGTIGVL